MCPRALAASLPVVVVVAVCLCNAGGGGLDVAAPPSRRRWQQSGRRHPRQTLRQAAEADTSRRAASYGRERPAGQRRRRRRRRAWQREGNGGGQGSLAVMVCDWREDACHRCRCVIGGSRRHANVRQGGSGSSRQLYVWIAASCRTRKYACWRGGVHTVRLRIAFGAVRSLVSCPRADIYAGQARLRRSTRGAREGVEINNLLRYPRKSLARPYADP